MNIHAPSSGLSIQVGNLPAATYAEMHNSSHELSTPAAENGYVKTIM